MSSCTPVSSATSAREKSAFRALLESFETAQPLTEATQTPSLRLKRSKRITLVLFGNAQSAFAYTSIGPVARYPLNQSKYLIPLWLRI